MAYLQIKLDHKGPDEISLVLDEPSRRLLISLLGNVEPARVRHAIRLKARIGDLSQTPVELVGLESAPHVPGDCKGKRLCRACANFHRQKREEKPR